jgi:DNA-binding NarL/FixJ family response regulator
MIYIDSNDSYFNNVDGIKIVDSHYKSTYKNEDVLFLDIDRFNTLIEIEEYYNKIPKSLKTVGFTSNPKLESGAYLVKCGFKSYISKDTESAVVKHALLTVMSGNVWLYPELLNFIIEKVDVSKEENPKKDRLKTLSDKEHKVADLVSKGYSNKEIADKLDVQVVTVKKHIGSIFSKLDIKDRLSLAMLIKSL